MGNIEKIFTGNQQKKRVNAHLELQPTHMYSLQCVSKNVIPLLEISLASYTESTVWISCAVELQKTMW